MTQITNNMSTKKSIDPGIVRSSIVGDNHNSQNKY
jgi:hypothetical protein